jgi:hypothetical protein
MVHHHFATVKDGDAMFSTNNFVYSNKGSQGVAHVVRRTTINDPPRSKNLERKQNLPARLAEQGIVSSSIEADSTVKSLFA